MKYDIAAYVWPSYTGQEPRTHIFWPRGIGEWETVQAHMNRTPVWGMRDEADPAVMGQQIEEALRHGVNTFIYDWYWYDNRPFLEQCLNDGFLGAPNNGKMKFFIMWANHDANTLWDVRNSHDMRTPIWEGAVGFEAFQTIVQRWTERYFCRENYYKIDGKPVLSVFDAGNLVRGLGGLERAGKALGWLREKLTDAGFGGLHLQLIKFGGDTIYPIAQALKADSITHYQTACYTDTNRDYAEWLPAMQAEWKAIDSKGLLYFPHVSVGWDSKPRFLKPKHETMTGCTPDKIKQALVMAKDYLDTHDIPPLVTINSWNEWTETSYLQPDNINGYGYLEAIKEVFCEKSE